MGTSMSIRFLHIPLRKWATKLARALLRWAKGDTMSNSDRSFRDPAAYTLVDIEVDVPCYCRGLYVTGAGDVSIQARPDSDPVVITAADNALLPIETHMVVNTQLTDDTVSNVRALSVDETPAASHVITDNPLGFVVVARGSGDYADVIMAEYTPSDTVRLEITELSPNTNPGTEVSLAGEDEIGVTLAYGSSFATADVTFPSTYNNLVFEIPGAANGTYLITAKLVLATGLTTATGIKGLQ